MLALSITVLNSHSGSNLEVGLWIQELWVFRLLMCINLNQYNVVLNEGQGVEGSIIYKFHKSLVVAHSLQDAV